MDAVPRAALETAASRQAGLRLLVLFGSQARGDATERSDWDFGYLATPDFDRDGLLLQLTTILNTDRIDLVDLDRAGGLIRFRAARDGVVLFERSEAFARFWFAAVSFWCDMGPVIRAGYDDVLAELSR